MVLKMHWCAVLAPELGTQHKLTLPACSHTICLQEPGNTCIQVYIAFWLRLSTGALVFTLLVVPTISLSTPGERDTALSQLQSHSIAMTGRDHLAAPTGSSGGLHASLDTSQAPHASPGSSPSPPVSSARELHDPMHQRISAEAAAHSDGTPMPLPRRLSMPGFQLQPEDVLQGDQFQADPSSHEPSAVLQPQSAFMSTEIAGTSQGPGGLWSTGNILSQPMPLQLQTALMSTSADSLLPQFSGHMPQTQQMQMQMQQQHSSLSALYSQVDPADSRSRRYHQVASTASEFRTPALRLLQHAQHAQTTTHSAAQHRATGPRLERSVASMGDREEGWSAARSSAGQALQEVPPTHSSSSMQVRSHGGRVYSAAMHAQVHSHSHGMCHPGSSRAFQC
jgi:hypothetical protein